MKLMLENTDKENQRLMAEGTLSGDVAQFTPILMPLVRRVYPNLIANNLLGMQSMSMPTGYIYALVNQLSGTHNNPTTNANGSIIVEVTSTAGGDTVAEVAPAEGDTITFSGGATGTVVYVEGDVTEGWKLLVNKTNASAVALGETITGLSSQDDDVVTVDATYSNEAAFKYILSGYTGTYATSAAEQLGKDMREVGFNISRKSVEAKSRALKGQYTVEMYQDLKAQHGLLADEEIMSLMGYEVQAEIDREVVDFVNGNATQLADTTFTADSTDGSGRHEIEKYRIQAIRISRESAQIGIDTKRGQGNTLLVSPKVATMLEQIGTYKAAPMTSGVKQPVSGGVAGTFDGRYKVVVDQYAASDYATVIYKGADRRDAMGFLAPYVPLSFTKVTHPDSGQPAVIAKTRYALDTIPGVSAPTSNDRAKTYARSFGVNFANTVLA
jgi:hypothetical protein